MNRRIINKRIMTRLFNQERNDKNPKVSLLKLKTALQLKVSWFPNWSVIVFRRTYINNSHVSLKQNIPTLVRAHYRGRSHDDAFDSASFFSSLARVLSLSLFLSPCSSSHAYVIILKCDARQNRFLKTITNKKKTLWLISSDTAHRKTFIW